MTMTLEAIVDGVSYSLSDDDNYRYRGDSGLGLPRPRHLTESGPMQHGASYVGFRLEPRAFAVLLRLKGETLEDYYTRRAELARILAPSDDPIQLRFTLPSGDVRQIDCHSSGVEFAHDERLGRLAHSVPAGFIAFDPTFYDPTGVSVTFALGGGGGGFSVPMAVPLAVGASTLDTSQDVSYAGTWDAYPIIRIVGPITNCIITNEATGEVLDLTGFTIDAGDEVQIDCRYGHKTVTHSDTVTYPDGNIIDKLTDDSDLSTFHLERTRHSEPKVNSIGVTGSAVDENTAIYFQYHTRYIGL
jgi:hypothetical protein